MARRRHLNRERVVGRAIEIADAAGDPAAVTLTALAEALGVRPPSLYNHVDSLDDLQQAMALTGVEMLTASLREVTAGLAGRPALVAVAGAYRHFVQAHPGLYPLTVRAPESDETALQARSQELVQILLLLMASVGLQGEEAIHAIRGLRAILHGFTSLEAAAGFKLATDREESFRRLVEAYLNGIMAEEAFDDDYPPA